MFGPKFAQTIHAVRHFREAECLGIRLRISFKSLIFLFLIAFVLFEVFSIIELRSTGQYSAAHSRPIYWILGSLGSKNFDGIHRLIASSKPSDPCIKPILKVFMYDLPPEFHFNLLGWKEDGATPWPDIRVTVPPYADGLNLQHSIEYWLTLDLLHSEVSESLEGRSAKRVGNSSEADVVFVPFFSSISYNRYSNVKNPEENVSVDAALQQKLVSFLKEQEEWKMSNGMDHIVVAHHPNSLLDARSKLWPAMFILSDFGRYPPTIANAEKDLIAPYRHMVQSFVNDSSGFDSRPTLLYFRGNVYRKDDGAIRHKLYYLLKDEPDAHFAFGTAQKNGIQISSEGMKSSKFCLNIAGDTPSSNRLFDSIASHCVPVIISDKLELPYEDVLDYSEFCIFISAMDAIKKDFILNITRNISKNEWTRMWRRLKEIDNFFEFQYPSRDKDAVQMIWQAVSRKLPTIRRKIHHSRRLPNAQNPGFNSFPLPPALRS